MLSSPNRTPHSTVILDISLLLDSRPPVSPPGDSSIKSRSSSPGVLRPYKHSHSNSAAAAYATPTSIAGSDYAAYFGENVAQQVPHYPRASSVSGNGFARVHHRHTSSVSSLGLAGSVPTSGTKRPGGNIDGAPAKKQSKWTPEEDALNVELRGSGMKWEDISKRLPGRSAISCRLRYQNYIERRSEWDEEKKNKLARLYERFKKEMWEKVAKELCMPYRAAEAMHWHMGEHEMAARANVPIFQLSNISTSVPPVPHNTSSLSAPAMHANYQGFSMSAGPSPRSSPPSSIPKSIPFHRRSNSALSAARRRSDSVKPIPNDSPQLPWSQIHADAAIRPQLKRPYTDTVDHMLPGFLTDFDRPMAYRRLHTPDSGGEEKKMKREHVDS
ncbi:MAG: hypothetical protein M1820_008553 [Bogoriella megaspora]|nr:MAG: hypothetical protein M1820_008553 [Bogoriella megaspora]